MASDTEIIYSGYTCIPSVFATNFFFIVNEDMTRMMRPSRDHNTWTIAHHSGDTFGLIHNNHPQFFLYHSYEEALAWVLHGKAPRDTARAIAKYEAEETARVKAIGRAMRKERKLSSRKPPWPKRKSLK